MLLAIENARGLAGRPYNIGGGPANAVSLNQVLRRIGELQGHPVEVAYGPRRIGDQPWFVSDTRCFEDATGWRPRVGVDEGLASLHAWLSEQAQDLPMSLR